MASAPERSCSVCRKRLPQEQLLRWAMIDGEVVQNKSDSRGYYSCQECTEKAPMVISGKYQARNDKRRA
jgi:predicted RNA-binding protein YlxR (DUF448 family)